MLSRQYRAFNQAIASLYGDDLPSSFADDKSSLAFDDSKFSDMAERIFREKGFNVSQLATPEGQALIAETFGVLRNAISSSITQEVPEILTYALENNAFVFSGFKTFHALREVGLSLTNPDGSIKPFERFLSDVQTINNRYNHNYLCAEYNQAVAASQMAVRWHEFEKDGDDYYLQYRTAGDSHVREEHAILHNTTLPIDDPFWEQFYPPNGWNCRCTAVQVRKSKYPMSDPELAMRRGQNCTDGAKRQIFRFNPGKSMRLYPEQHPYYKVPAVEKKEFNKLAVIEGRKRAVEYMPLEEEKVICDNLYSEKLYQANKPRRRLLSHCYNSDELAAAVYFWNNPQVLGSPRISILGENKDMDNPKAQKNIESKKKRGVCEYIEYRATYKGVNWLIKTERHKNGFEQFYCIKKEN